MNQNEINITATCIAALANQPNCEEKIKLLLTSLLASNKKADFNVEKNTEPSASSKIIFSQKEINLMPKTFRKEFRADGCTARIRKKQSGKKVIFTKYVTVETDMIYPLPTKILKKQNGSLSNS